jgi:photosystem II stability/assembly factor-like uncharacterized protein
MNSPRDRCAIARRTFGSALLLTLAGGALAAPFADPLNTPALMRTTIANRPFLAVAVAGKQLVAVGSRGMIATSADQGKTWQQAKVPVQSDLLALHFPTATLGWAVGHDGVILHSADGGASWVKQLDGRSAEKAFKQTYQAQAEAGDEAAKAALATLEQNFKAGPALPFLDVWFEDANTGYAVGSFGMLAVTQDGGKTWTPGLHRVDNEQQLNLNAVRGINGDILLAAERGQVFRLDRAKGRFTAVNSGYTGSFFGFVGNAQAVLAFGLRGVVYRSADQGRSWAPVQVPGGASVAAGATRPGNAGVVLVNAAGQLILGNAAATEFTQMQTSLNQRLTGVVVLEDGTVVTSGLGGLHTQRLPGQP